VSVTALPLTANGLLSPDLAFARTEGESIAIHKAIFDDRYAESQVFAETLGRFSVPLCAIENGDITKLWYDELDLLWREKPIAIAGSTQFGPMFALERLATERGMRVALRVEHQVRADGTVAHVLTGPAETMALADYLRQQGADWPVLMAVLAAHCHTDAAAPVEHTMVMPGAKPVLRPTPASPRASAQASVIHYYTPQAIREGHGVPWDGPLFSWVIAPAPRARLVSSSPRP
jgi:hypothetical protein